MIENLLFEPWRCHESLFFKDKNVLMPSICVILSPRHSMISWTTVTFFIILVQEKEYAHCPHYPVLLYIFLYNSKKKHVDRIFIVKFTVFEIFLWTFRIVYLFFSSFYYYLHFDWSFIHSCWKNIYVSIYQMLSIQKLS